MKTKNLSRKHERLKGLHRYFTNVVDSIKNAARYNNEDLGPISPQNCSVIGRYFVVFAEFSSELCPARFPNAAKELNPKVTAVKITMP